MPDVPGEPVIVMFAPGCPYDPHTPLARRRRVEGLCGWCGHPTHNRKVGCEVCGPEVCPITFEAWGDAAAKMSSKISRISKLAAENPEEYARRCRSGEPV